MGAVQVCGVAAVALWLAALTVCDIRQHRLPNVLTLPGAVVVLAVLHWVAEACPQWSGPLRWPADTCWCMPAHRTGWVPAM